MMPLSWMLGDLVFWNLFPARINRVAREANCITIPEFVSYTVSKDRTSLIRTFLALVGIVFIGLYAIGQFLAAGKAIHGAIDVSFATGIALSAFVIMAYSAKGGLQSSIPTQFAQAIIMLLTTTGMFLYALVVAGGPAEILGELRFQHPDLLRIDGGRGLLLFAAFVFGFASTAFTFDIGQPHLLVRIMATKSPKDAAGIKWIYIAFMQLTWGMMSLFGLIMVVSLPDISDAEQAFPTFARENLHPIMAGAVLAGVFAAVASTLDALLLVISSSLGVDMLPKTFSRMTNKFGARYQILVTMAVTVVIALIAVNVAGATGVMDIMFFGASGVGVTVGCAVLISILKWKTSSTALLISTMFALVVAATWRAFGLSDYVLEAAPGFITGILVHQIYARLFLRSKGGIENARHTERTDSAS
jgi:Na+/proline symporter